MFGWLGKLFGARSAAESKQRDPNVKAIVKASSEAYADTPLNRLLDSASAERIARDLYLEINGICNAAEPVSALREKLAAGMLRFSLYQVLVLKPEPEDDKSGLRGMPGITGELAPYIERLVPRNIALREDVHASPHYSDGTDLVALVTLEYWKNHWRLATLDAARRQLGDAPTESDWFFAFKHAACANQENLYRIDLDLPSAFDPAVARTAPTACSIFTDIVVAGAESPLDEWREYHAGQPVPEPGGR